MATFTEPVGPTVPLPSTALEIFRLFFTTALFQLIVAETNLYAAKVLEGAVEEKWTDINEDDVSAFLGFALLMGINWLPQLKMYWSKQYSFHLIAERIPRDRFLSIWRYLHFTSETSPYTQPSPTAASASPTRTAASASPLPTTSSASHSPGSTGTHDRLYKVRPILSAVVAACRKNYRPHREQAIDEAMVAFKGRSSMKQYNPMKPVKRGFKIWTRADSHNGYVCEFECYTGRKEGVVEKGLGGSVVTRLTRDLVGKAYHIYMDNFFSSVPLYQNLLQEMIYCTGTLMPCPHYDPG